MAVSRAYLDYVLGQLAELGQVRARRMFGGVGLYRRETFFAIISADTLYLRVDEASRGHYSARGMEAFRPYANRPEVSMSYFAVPAEVLEDAQELALWGRRAVDAALALPRRAAAPVRGAGAKAARSRQHG